MTKGFFFKAACVLLTLAGAACSSDTAYDEDGSALTGKRVSVLNYGADLTADNDALKKTITLPAPQKTTQWRQAGGVSSHVMQNPYLAERIGVAWKKSIGSASRKDSPLIAEPVGADGVVYTIDTRALVRAFRVENGKRVWQKRLREKGSSSVTSAGAGLALDNGVLFAATGDGNVFALDAVDGKEIWKTKLSAPVRSAPAVYGGRIFVLTSDNKLVALSENDGAVLWTHFAFLEAVSFLGKAAPALDAGVGIAVFPSGEILAFRPESGNILWSESLGASRLNDASAEINDIRARPVIAGDKAIVMTSGGLLTAFDIKTGGVVWEKEIGGIDQPWVAGKTVFVVTNYAELAALDVQTGKLLWINKLARWADADAKDKRLNWTGPVMAGSRLIVTNSDGKAIAVSPQTGTVIGWDDIDSKGTLMPIVLDDTLFFITHNGQLAAYR